MTTPAGVGPQPTVHLVLEVPPGGRGVDVAVDPAAPVLDETSGEGSGSGWRLFEPVPGEVSPWLSLGEVDRGCYRRDVRLPDRVDPVVWSVTCQVSVTWTPGPDAQQLRTTVDSVTTFVLPAGGVHTVTAALEYVPGEHGDPPRWTMSLGSHGSSPPGL